MKKFCDCGALVQERIWLEQFGPETDEPLWRERHDVCRSCGDKVVDHAMRESGLEVYSREDLVVLCDTGSTCCCSMSKEFYNDPEDGWNGGCAYREGARCRPVENLRGFAVAQVKGAAWTERAASVLNDPEVRSAWGDADEALSQAGLKYNLGTVYDPETGEELS
jgi:hypothetical protein